VHVGTFDEGDQYDILERFSLEEEVKNRLGQVCGSTSYSIVLRNSEHFARYIYCGRWVSTQMLPGERIYEQFIKQMPQRAKAFINTTLPCELETVQIIKPVYTHQKAFIEYKGKSSNSHTTHTALSREDAFNIAILGPTGCGKSHLINLLFNKTVCKSASQAESVTQHVTIYSGFACVYKEPRLVNVIDTVGFCDTKLTPKEVERMIRQSIHNNFIHLDKIVIVCSGRIENGHKAAIQQFMDWFRYPANWGNFALVYGKCDGLSQDERAQGIMDACRILEFKSNLQRIVQPELVPRWALAKENEVNIVSYQITTAFPPSAPYDDIKHDLYALIDAVFTPQLKHGKFVRIPLKEGSCCIL